MNLQELVGIFLKNTWQMNSHVGWRRWQSREQGGRETLGFGGGDDDGGSGGFFQFKKGHITITKTW
jgi:hypothetical protein